MYTCPSVRLSISLNFHRICYFYGYKSDDSFIHSSIHSFIHPVIYSFIYSFMEIAFHFFSTRLLFCPTLLFPYSTLLLCSTPLFTSLILLLLFYNNHRGASREILTEVENIISFCIVLAYHLRLEVAYYNDRFAQLPASGDEDW